MPELKVGDWVDWVESVGVLTPVGPGLIALPSCFPRRAVSRGTGSATPFLHFPKPILMWRHIEPDRLLQCVQGKELLESEADHLASCEDCLELLIFFQEQISN